MRQVGRRFLLGSIGVVLAVLLAACPQTPAAGTPAKATFNGVSNINTVAGTADLSVSALDSGDNVLTSGTITDPSVTITSVTANGVTSQQSFSATAKVCGQITAKLGDIRAVLTLDATGSMGSSDPMKLRADAAKQFVSRMDSSDQAAVASFDTSTPASSGFLAIKLWQSFTGDKAALNTAVDSATKALGATNLWDALKDSVDLTSTASAGNKLVVGLTDGFDNSSSKTPADVISAAQASKVTVFTVGLGSSVNSTDLIKIASQTGGAFAQVTDAAGLTGLFDSIFNASVASGCIQVQFSPAPPSGTTITGTLTFKVNGVILTVTFTITFP